MNTIEQWDNAAEKYSSDQEQSEFVEANKSIIMGGFINLQNKSLLDLGCGYGWYTNYFTKIGAKAIGCDGSRKMIELAKNRYPKLEFEQTDILKKLPYRDNSFDFNGIFYMSIVHPAFYDCHWGKDEHGFKKAKIMERYLSEYSFDNEFWGKTKHYHRTVSQYLNTIISSGFSLTYLDEPKSYDGLDKSAEFPLFLIAEFEKSSYKK